MRTNLFLGAAALAIVSTALTAQAAVVASDNASDVAYDDGWTTGDNGGTGFGPWTLVSGTGDATFQGHFVGNSDNNNVFQQGNINTGSPGEAFGVYDFNSGAGTSAAIRPFTGALLVGQSFSVDFDNGGVNVGRRVGFQLRDAAGNARFEFSFLGGTAFNPEGDYDVIGASTQDTVATFTSAGIRTVFTLTGPDTFAFNVSYNGVFSPEVFTGTLGGVAGSGLTDFRAYNDNEFGGSENDIFVNSLAISPVIPEPASLAALGALGLVALRRRH